MAPENLLKVWFSSFAPQIAVLLVCLLGCVAVLVSWRKLSSGAWMALAGLLLQIVLCFAIPSYQTLWQRWIAVNHPPIAQIRNIITGVGIFWSILHAASFGLLLGGVLMGRSAPAVRAY